MSESNIRRAVRANGVRLATERMPHVRSVAVGIWLVSGRDPGTATGGDPEPPPSGVQALDRTINVPSVR